MYISSENCIMIKLLNKVAGRFGWQLVPLTSQVPPDMEGDVEFMGYYKACRPYTMTSPERLYALYQAVKYVIRHQIPGDFVECGVWKGGSSMMIAYVLNGLGVTDRTIWMYDTYEGMSAPEEVDQDYTGVSAAKQLSQAEKEDRFSVWCYSSLEEVKQHVQQTNYPLHRFRFIKGKVEDTIPGELPDHIALLRLDTDWYASTRHELIHLYPRLAKQGPLIIDDFGHWEGAKKAVLEFMQENSLYPLLNRIDDTGRIFLK